MSQWVQCSHKGPEVGNRGAEEAELERWHREIDSTAIASFGHGEDPRPRSTDEGQCPDVRKDEEVGAPQGPRRGTVLAP